MRRLQMSIGVLVAGMFVASQASGAMMMELSSGGNTVTVNDNGAGDLSPILNAILFNGAVGNWNFNVTTGLVGVDPLLDLNSIDQVTGSGTGANALTLKLSATGYSGPLLASFLSQIGGTLAAAHTLTYAAYFDASDTLGAATTAIGPVQSFGPGGAFSGTVLGPAVPAGLYSLTQIVTISGASNGSSSFNAAITPTPEPGTVVLLLTGVAFLAGGRLRRSN